MCYDINKEYTYSFPTHSLHLTFISFPGTLLFLTVLKFHKIYMLCNLFEYNLFMENQIFPFLTTKKKDPETNVLIVTSLSSGVFFQYGKVLKVQMLSSKIVSILIFLFIVRSPAKIDSDLHTHQQIMRVPIALQPLSSLVFSLFLMLYAQKLSHV